jgi:membrane-associated protein
MAIVGGNIGYGIGYSFGTRLLTAPGWLGSHRNRLFTTGKPLVQKYGWLAVLVSRDVTVLRECTPLLAGSLRMPWRRYVFWNSIGAVAWVLAHVLLGFFVGATVGAYHGLEIIIGLKIATVVALMGIAVIRRLRSSPESSISSDEADENALANGIE